MPGALEYIKNRGIPFDKIAFIPPGTDPVIFQNSSQQLPAKLAEIIDESRSHGKFIAGYAGAIGIANSLRTIIDAAEELHNKDNNKIHFILVGDGPEKEKLTELIRIKGLDNISIADAIPKNSIASLLSKMDILLLAWKHSDLYTKYGIGSNKLWDYMMAAKPIAWAVESINDPVKDAGCGITVPPENPEQLAKAILQLYNLGDKKRAEMGKRGYKYVMENNSTPVLAQRFLDLIYAIK